MEKAGCIRNNQLEMTDSSTGRTDHCPFLVYVFVFPFFGLLWVEAKIFLHPLFTVTDSLADSITS